MAGRPLKYETVEKRTEQLESWELSQKVEVQGSFRYDDFDDEEDLCDYIELNAQRFCNDVLEADYIRHEREYNINAFQYFGPRPKRVDFLFVTDKGSYLVECKTPTNTYAELRNAISQLMDYNITAIDNGVPVVGSCIVANAYHPVIPRIIEHYNMGIDYFILGRGRMLKFKEMRNVSA